MNDYGQSFSFGSPSGGSVDYAQPYIPEAVDCRQCGYCLRGCPTYKVRAEENYSPRGRVRLIERLLRKNDTLSADEYVALTSCTLCRACETTCPSKMPYAVLYRQALQAFTAKPEKSPALKVMVALFAEGRLSPRVLKTAIALFQKSGMARLLKMLPDSASFDGFKQLGALLPVPFEGADVPDHAPASAPHHHGQVALFTGCVGSVLDEQTHSAAMTMLSRLGFTVRVLPEHSCCGAMHAHDGDVARAKDFARANLDAFAKCGASAIISTSSGCGAFLSEYETLLDDETDDGAHAPQPPVIDIMSFLLEHGRVEALSFDELAKTVAVHEPCSQRNVLKNQDAIYQALARIPKLDVVPLADSAMCCGAGGTKLVTQPELAAPLRDAKVQALLDSGAEILLSTNLTCALHLARGVREAGREIKVLHPVSLLAQCVI